MTFPVSASTSHRTTTRSAVPLIDPELLIRMLIVGYCFGIRSERRLCEEVRLNLAYRWFCRLGLEGDVPNHSTFSKMRHGRFRDADLLRELFETVVRRCMREGLVDGEGFAVNASMIVADAHRQRGIETPEELNPKAQRAVAEYLATLDDAAFGAATPVEPKHVSPVDPAARWTAAWGGPAVYAYCTNYLIDVEHAIIVDVEASTAVRQAEVTAAKTRAYSRRTRPVAGTADCRHRLRLVRAPAQTAFERREAGSRQNVEDGQCEMRRLFPTGMPKSSSRELMPSARVGA